MTTRIPHRIPLTALIKYVGLALLGVVVGQPVLAAAGAILLASATARHTVNATAQRPKEVPAWVPHRTFRIL